MSSFSKRLKQRIETLAGALVRRLVPLEVCSACSNTTRGKKRWPNASLMGSAACAACGVLRGF